MAITSVSKDFIVKHGLVVTTTATILSDQEASSTVTGALIVGGGAGIGGNLWVGGDIHANLAFDGTATDYGVYYDPITNAFTYYDAASGSSTGTTSTFVIDNPTASTSTQSGALQVVNGGAGIGGNVHVGKDLVANNIQEVTDLKEELLKLDFGAFKLPNNGIKLLKQLMVLDFGEVGNEKANYQLDLGGLGPENTVTFKTNVVTFEWNTST